jgi:tetratricopeptide (TPR) repeat protein
LKIWFVQVVYWALGIGITLALYACSQEKHTFVARNWHNLHARDNAYFLANDRLKELENEIDTKTQSNYNRVLFPVTIIDTNQTKSYKDKTDDIIKKASLPITMHKNSYFVDNSYILVGKCRVLRGEWKLALETFKFVNAEGESEERYEALTQMMRLFLLKRDFRSAGYVMDYLEKQEFKSKKNIRDFSLTKAQYYRHQENYFPMIKNIETAIPLVKGKKEKKARLYFILGQVFQFQKNDSMAYLNYKKAIKNNPPYELSFYSKLYLAQVTSIHNANDKKRTDRYFKKLLKDKKNLEYKDKIYYEMALFEYKQKKIPKAINYLEKSVYESRGNKYQKGATYLKLGEIYYENLKNFETAKLYYDSAVAVWDKNDPQYKEISERQKVLESFVKNLLIVRREDSLQRLAKMDSVSLDKFIDKVIEDEEAARILKAKQVAAAKKRASEIQATAATQVVENSNPADVSTWYFYNNAALSRGATDFVVKWGTRKQEDNWRRSVKDTPIDNGADNATPQDSTNAGTTTKIAPDSTTKNKKPKIDKSLYYKDIPFTDAQMNASDQKIQEALYNLGRIYNLKLGEPELAIKTFEDLLKRYPNYKNAPEVLYFLYLINIDQKNFDRAEYWKRKLISEYPKSIYAKMLINPNYLKESKEENKLVASLYRQAFETYERNDFIAADSMLVSIIKAHPDNEIMDRIRLLRILITGRTKNALVYKTQLQDFINDKENEFSTTLPRAKEMLANSDEFLKKLNEKGGEIKASDVRYSTNTSKPHFFVAVFENKKAKKEVVQKQFTIYNKKYHPDQNLTLNTLKLSDTTFAIVVETFEAMYPSKQYRDQIITPGTTVKPFESALNATFFITDDNYKLFYKDKNVNTYLEFFKKNY